MAFLDFTGLFSMKVEKGNFVQVHYTGTLDDGSTFDTSEGKDPLETLVGHDMLIKGFDNALIGMEEGEEKEITIPSNEAYGDRHEDLVKEISKADLGEDVQAEVGMTLGVKTPDGHVFPATVKAVSEEGITLDANHPLAGQTLHFKLTLVSARAATEEDLKKFGHEHCDHDHGEDTPATEEAPADDAK